MATENTPNPVRCITDGIKILIKDIFITYDCIFATPKNKFPSRDLSPMDAMKEIRKYMKKKKKL